MIADPWSDHRTASIGPDERVLAVGTGLTMVDQVLALAARGHRGPITAVSRRGHLPAAHRARRTEPRTIDLPPGPLSTRTLVRLVVAAARDDVAAGGDWRAVVDGLRPVTQDTWGRLGHAERRRFCRHVESLWSAVRHRMAPEVAARLDALRNAGPLTVRPGRVVAVKATPRGLVVAIRARGGRTAELAGFDWMLNCAGTGRFAVNAFEAPFGPLVAAELLKADRLGRGVEVTPLGEAIGRDGAATPGLYALGPLGAGSLLEITAIPDIREQCAAAAQRIADRVGSPSLPAAWSRAAVVRLRG